MNRGKMWQGGPSNDFSQTLELYDSVLDMCAKRCNSWGDEVQGRLQQCIDFVAAEAVYHQKCEVMFKLGKTSCLCSGFHFVSSKFK